MRILPLDLNKDYTDVINEACHTLRASGTVVYPTDTVYCLGANACDSVAVEKVFQIKQRSRSKPLPVLVRNLVWAKELAYIDKQQEKILAAIWPSAVTVVLPKRDYLSPLTVASGVTVALRVVAYPLVDQLLTKLGYPLTATAATISGQAGERDSNKVAEIFTASVRSPNLLIDAGILPPSEPATVLDLTGAEPKIIKVGMANPGKLMELLRKVV